MTTKRRDPALPANYDVQVFLTRTDRWKARVRADGLTVYTDECVMPGEAGALAMPTYARAWVAREAEHLAGDA